jgi:hypothetical protein
VQALRASAPRCVVCLVSSGDFSRQDGATTTTPASVAPEGSPVASTQLPVTQIVTRLSAVDAPNGKLIAARQLEAILALLQATGRTASHDDRE